MKKTFGFFAIIWALFLALFNVIVFVTPNEAGGMTKFGGAFWVGYIFITIALYFIFWFLHHNVFLLWQ